MKKLRLVQLAAVIFLTVSGGPYGLESLFAYAGRNASLLLLMVTPLLWDIPTIAAVLELNSMLPMEGGYYQWVKKRWAFALLFMKDGGRGCIVFVDLAILSCIVL